MNKIVITSLYLEKQNMQKLLYKGTIIQNVPHNEINTEKRQIRLSNIGIKNLKKKTFGVS